MAINKYVSPINFVHGIDDDKKYLDIIVTFCDIWKLVRFHN